MTRPRHLVSFTGGMVTGLAVGGRPVLMLALGVLLGLMLSTLLRLSRKGWDHARSTLARRRP